ncbi:MAG: hypothetical protein GY927_13375 [bacterium]|nr:hypothetical protein [bacterium]
MPNEDKCLSKITINPAIYIFLDNGRYHHAKVVKKWIKSTNSRIKLMFLPACAPHLNRIERL